MVGRELDLFGTEEKYVMTKEDVDILRRFQNRTVFTIGTARSVHVYRHEIVKMVCSVCWVVQSFLQCLLLMFCSHLTLPTLSWP